MTDQPLAPGSRPLHMITGPVIHLHGGERLFHLHPGDTRHEGDIPEPGGETVLDMDHFKLAGEITWRQEEFPGLPALTSPAHVLSCLSCGSLVMPEDQKIHRGSHDEAARLAERLDQHRQAILTAAMMQKGEAIPE